MDLRTDLLRGHRSPLAPFSIVALLLSMLVGTPSLDAQPLLDPATMTNRPLGIPGDASSVAWNPALIGTTEEADLVGGMRYDTALTSDNLTAGIFASAWYLGAGVILSSNDLIEPRFHAGFGFPLEVLDDVPLHVGAGLGWTNGTSAFGDGDLGIGIAAEPVSKVMVGLSINDLLDNAGGIRSLIDAEWFVTDWLDLRGRLAIGPEAVPGGTSSTATNSSFGADFWLFDRVVTASTTYDLDREEVRFGVEMLFGRDFILGSFNRISTSDGIGFGGGVGTVRYRPSGVVSDDDGPIGLPRSPRKGWAPDRSYRPEGLSYKYSVSDATEDPMALKRPCDVAGAGFDDPADLVKTVERGGADYSELATELRTIAPDPSELYKQVRRTYYSRPVRSAELMSDDSLTLRNRQGYSIGVQRIDNSEFPLVSVYLQATDSVGRSVAGLGPNDFFFTDESLEIVSVRPIDSTRRLPVDVTLLIDCSGSMGDEIEAVRSNARAFVDKMERSGADYRIGGVLYGSLIYDTLHPTADFDRFRSFVSNAAAIGGDEISSLAIAEGTRMNYRPDAQRILVMITDDWVIQQNAELTESDLVGMLWDARARLYQIGNLCKNNAAVTTRLALGREYDVRAPFNSILDDIGTDITTSYELVYRSRMKEVPKVTILRGRVRDEAGRPVGTDLLLGESLNSSRLTVRTNRTTGEYEVEIVEGKKYSAEITANGYLPLSEEVDLRSVRKGDTVVRNFLLTIPETTLEGRILDQNDRGVPGKVRIEDATTLEVVKVVDTDNTGYYKTPIVEGRLYRLTPVVPDHLPTPEQLDTRETPKGTKLKKDLRVMSIDFALQTGATFRLENIFFDFDKADLKPESIPELEKLVGLLEEYPSIRVEIGAHTDSDGSDSYNIDLSKRRAASVVAWLVDEGIESTRLETKGYGETRPIATNETDEGRAQNRRVEFKLVR